VSLNLGSGLECLKFSRDVILLMNIVVYIGTRQLRIFLTNRLNDARRHGNRSKRITRRDYLTCALSNNVTSNRFWKLCGSFGIHSKLCDLNIDFKPNEINDYFAASINNGDVLDNYDTPSGHLVDPSLRYWMLLRVFLVMLVGSMEYA
jgi:hypothetical protein